MSEVHDSAAQLHLPRTPIRGLQSYPNSSEGFAVFKQNYETLLIDGLVVLEAIWAYEQALHPRYA